MIKNLISRLTMVKTTRPSFYDKWAGETVYYWQDCYFQTFMATSRWGYRIKLY